MDTEQNCEELSTKWAELVELVKAVELDVLKNARGNSAAGVRARKGLRDLKGRAHALTQLSVVTDKSRKVVKPKKEKAGA